MTELPDGFDHIFNAPADIVGKPLTMLHWAGATERMTIQSKEEATEAYYRGWKYYRLDPPDEATS